MISAFGINHGEVSKSYGIVKPLKPGLSQASRKPPMTGYKPAPRAGSATMKTGKERGSGFSNPALAATGRVKRKQRQPGDMLTPPSRY